MSTQLTQPYIIKNDFYQQKQTQSFSDAAAEYAKNEGPTEMMRPAQIKSQLGLHGDMRPSNPIQGAIYDLNQQLMAIEATLNDALSMLISIIMMVMFFKAMKAFW